MGETLASPYRFIQQALNQLAGIKYDSFLKQYESVDVTIHLGKGSHYFFACFEDGFMADMADYDLNEITDFCAEIETLRPVYQKIDQLKLTLKPLTCSLDNA